MGQRIAKLCPDGAPHLASRECHICCSVYSCRPPATPSRRARKFDKREKGARRDPRRGRPATGPSGGRPEAQQARRPAKASTGRREPGTQRPAAAREVGDGGQRACLRSAATRAALPAASPHPGFPCQLLRRPLCSCLLWRLFARAGRAHRLRSAACRAIGGGGAALASARPGGSVPQSRDVGRDAAAQPEGGAGGSGSGGGWSVAADDGSGTKGVYLPAVEPVLADIALDHEAVHVVRLPAYTVHRRRRRGRRGPTWSRHRHRCRGGSSCCSRGHRRRRSGHL